MKHYLILGLAPALALAACGDSTPNTTDGMATNMDDMNMAGMDMTGDNMAGMETNMAAEVSPAQRFANDVGASDYYEVEAGKLAQEKAQNQALKDFGRMMVDNHTQSTEKLKAAGAKANPAIVPNPALTAEQETNLAALRAAEGAAFDQAYKAQQIAAHEKALALVQGYAADGDVPELKSFATDAQKVIQEHLTKIRGM
jgi:putative membrane protein